MIVDFRVPLAWLNLIHEKRRLAVSLAGICFAVLLMFMEYGFWQALFDSGIEVIRRLDADLILTSRSRFALVASQQFPRSRLLQAQAVPGVQSAYPLYVEYYRSEWKNPDAVPPDNSPLRSMRVLAFDPAHNLLRIPEVQAQIDKLRLPDAALVDRRSRSDFGRLTPGTERELAGRRIRVVGTFQLGTDFTANGNAIVSDVTFAGLFPDRATLPVGDAESRRGAGQGGENVAARLRSNPLRAVDVGLVKMSAHVDPVAVKSALRSALPGDVAVFTLEEFIEQEKDFWGTTTPIGFVFGLGMVMGFTIGAGICYQILSADVGDHLAEYATLKAIGYRNRHLTWVILQEALLLAVLGFLPGIALGGLLYSVVAGWTGLPMRLTLARSLLILVLTLVMCALSGVIALGKVQAADPAEVF